MQTRFRFVESALALILFGALSSTVASADVLAFTPPATGVSPDSSGPWTLGNIFTTSTSLVVDALGIYNTGNLTASQEVVIYNSSQAILASTTVPPNDPTMVGGYLMESITPITLPAGTYIVASVVPFGGWDFGAAPLTAAGVTFDSTAYNSGSTLTYPTQTFAAAPAYYGPDFEIQTATSAAPEPGSWTLLAAGVGLLIASKRRRAG